MSASTSAAKIAWKAVCGEDINEQQVFEALELLSNSRHNLGRITLQQASALASFISAQNTPPPWLSQGSLNAVINSWHLLSRWAAQLRSTLSASAATEVAANTSLLSQAVTHACRLLVACRHGVISRTAVGLVGSLVLFLGNASYGQPMLDAGLAQDQRMQSLQQVTAILHESAPDVVANPAFVDVAAGVGHLLASTQAERVANMSLLSTIITCSKRAGTAEETLPDLIALMPLYDMMKSASRGSHSSPVSQSHSAASDWATALVSGMRSASLVERAACSLCCGGLLEARGTALSIHPPATAVLLSEALLQACSEAASACYSAGDSIPPSLRLWQDALALSTWKASEACGLPHLSVDTWQCQLRAVLGGCLRLDGVFDVARAQQPAAHASAWLRRQIAGAPAQLAGPLGCMVAGQYRHMSSVQQQHFRSAVHHGGGSLHAAYSSFTLHTAPAWIQELNQGAVRQMLDKLFMTYLVQLSTIWEVAASGEGQQSQQEAAVLVLDVLANLHFCRMRLSAHTSLIQATLSVVSESAEATIGLLVCLPSWSALTAVVGSVQEPAWLADALLASRMQFLFNVLTPCVAAAPQAAVDRGTPAMLLFLQHPSPAMCNAAHAYFCGLVQAAPLDLRDSLAGAYLKRALPAYPAVVPAASLALALDTLARALPVNSPASPLAAHQVAYRTIQLLQQPLQREAAVELSRMLFQLLLVIDINAFKEALAAAELVVLNSPHDRRAMLCTELFKTVSGSDDYVRKLRLTRWYQQLVANLDCAVDPLSQTTNSKDATP